MPLAAPAVIYAAPTPAPATPRVIALAAAAPVTPAVPPAPTTPAPVTPRVIALPAAAPVTPAAAYTPPANLVGIRASLTSGNLLWTAVDTGPGGDAITRTIAAPGESYLTVVEVAGTAITVTPAHEAMIIGGELDPDIAAALLYAGIANGKAHWTSNGLPEGDNRSNGVAFRAVYFGQSKWRVVSIAADNSELYYSEVASTAESPAGLTFGAPETGTGVPSVTADPVTKADVITAVTASAAASALVTLAASGDVSGAVVTAASANLAGGLGPAAPAVI